MSAGRNRIGIISLGAAAAGFLFVTFQPWFALERLVLFGTLNLRALLSAFFDASLVGALADWFAVTALFKRPLGINLPHTDILARNKDAIAEAVPRFLTSFVSEEKISGQLGTVDFAAKVEQLLAEGSTRSEINEFLHGRMAAVLAGVRNTDGQPSEAFTSVVREIVQFAAARIDPARTAGAFLRWTREERLDEGLVAGAAEMARAGIAENIEAIADTLTPLVKRNAGWQGIFVGRGTIERLLRGAQEELERFGSNTSHDLRLLLRERLLALSVRLEGNTAHPDPVRDRLRSSFQGLVADPQTPLRAARLLAAALSGISSAFPEGAVRLEEVFLTQLRANPGFRRAFNRGVAGLVSSLIARSGLIEGVTGYLAGLLKNTDEREFVRRVEDAVWNDLQYIRFNGAVVGGLVGIFLAIIRGTI